MILTLTRRVLRCDACQTATIADENQPSVAHLRRLAKTRGWTRRVDGRDRCKVCSS